MRGDVAKRAAKSLNSKEKKKKKKKAPFLHKTRKSRLPAAASELGPVSVRACAAAAPAVRLTH